MVAALVESLIAAGHPARQIVIWDRYESDLRAAGYFELAARYGVRVKGANEAGYDESQFYESPFIGQLIWGISNSGGRAVSSAANPLSRNCSPGTLRRSSM